MRKGGAILILFMLISMLLWMPVQAEEAEWKGVLSGTSFAEMNQDGFHVPLPEGEGWQGGAARGIRGLFAEALGQDAKGNTLTYQAMCQSLDQFAYNETLITRYYNSVDFSHLRNVVMDHVLIDGQPARLVTFTYDEGDGSFGAHGGIVLYAREMRLLQIRIYSEGRRNRERNTPKVTLEDLKQIAARIVFVPEEAPIRYSDVSLTLNSEEGIHVLASGGKLQLSATYGNAALAATIREDQGVTWELVDEDTGEPSTVAQISSKGLITAEKGIAQIRTVRAQATSVAWGTSASLTLTVLPAATGLTVEPASLTFYAEEDHTELLTARLEPDFIPAMGITWSINKKDLLEIIDHGNGTATVRPLFDGKGTLTVREPGGKTFSVPVKVLRPVTALELTRKGQPVAGATVIYNVKLTPYNPGDRTVSWSLDVGEDIATISRNGKLKISKSAPEGTVFHVSCTSQCAPVPVVATDEIVVMVKATKPPKSTETPAPTDTPEPTETPAPTETPEPTDTPEPTETPVPTETPAPTEMTEPTEASAPTEMLTEAEDGQSGTESEEKPVHVQKDGQKRKDGGG